MRHVDGRRRSCSTRPTDIAGDGRARCPRSPTPPDVEETGATLEANARIKASALADALGLLADRRRHRARSRRARRRARRVLGALRRRARDLRRQRREAARASSKACTRRCAPRGSRRSRGALARRPRARGARRGRGRIAAAPRGRERLRLRPGVRAGRGRRPHVCGDDAGRETCALAPRSGVPRRSVAKLLPRDPRRSDDAARSRRPRSIIDVGRCDAAELTRRQRLRDAGARLRR